MKTVNLPDEKRSVKATKPDGPIRGLGGVMANNMLVAKTDPLLTLAASKMTLQQLKLLDIYLGRIDSHDPSRREVEFSKKDLEQILGVNKINLRTLDERLGELMKQVVRVDDSNDVKGYRLIALFEEAKVELGDDGIQKICLECTNKAMKYIFNVEKMGYLKYTLQSVVQLQSRYSYVLFLYLKKNCFRKKWTIPINQLKQILQCDSEAYDRYKALNQHVLKRCQKEIVEKTELSFEYSAIKRGRGIAAVEFRITSKITIPVSKDAEVIEFVENASVPTEDTSYELMLYGDACENAFDQNQLRYISSLLVAVPEDILPDVGIGDISLRRYHYLQQTYLRMKSQKTVPRNQFRYFCSMIKNK